MTPSKKKLVALAVVALIGARGNFLNFLDLRRAGSGDSQPDSSLTSDVCEVARALSPKAL